MKTIRLVAACTALCSVALLAPLLAPTPVGAQGAAPPPAPGDVRQLVQALVAQQTEMDQNNKKLQEKIAMVAEELRKTNIYVTRGGGKTQ